MQITKTHKIIISALAVIILLGIYITFDRNSKKNFGVQDGVTNLPLATTTNETTTKEIGNTGINVAGEGNFKVVQVSNTPNQIPDLDRKIIFGQDSSLTPEIKTLISQKVTDLQTQLKKDSNNFSNWINLGIYQKMAGDYNGAVISWQYAGKISPASYVPFGNLGDLYAHFLKDNVQAEMYYKEAISKGPMQAYLYIQLAEVYRDVFKDLDKARAIISQGLSKIPNDPSLLQFQELLK
ncbi:MAG: hypothetical protein NTX96_02715 [Candidatus Zambryskibacteria bacterium]|nr:hypothetical protein [Candidatus Zambryskibacteria bacterium]